jgi:hypothetical protein
MTLTKRDAKLRWTAVTVLFHVSRVADTASSEAMHNHPRRALQAISRAEAHLAKAKRALRLWGG